MNSERLQTGNPELDRLLGGGLLPGTLTVVMGATGIGKTQLGLQFAHHGASQEGERGIVFDLTARGDSQHHAEYARRLFGWEMHEQQLDVPFDPEAVWDRQRARRDAAHIFHRAGRRVTFSDLELEEFELWKIELMKKLDRTISFFYSNFVQGVRRLVVDGVEPADKASDSFQFHVFNYVYHQILHKDADWVARDLFRARFRENAERVQQNLYDHRELACLLLYTSHEVLLDDLLSRPLQSGDELSNANTIILMGKIREGGRMGRALHVAKHRGSACDEAIVPFEIDETGLRLRPS